MSLNKNGMDLKAIRRDQKEIDKLPNKGRASIDHSKNKKKHIAKKMKSSQKVYDMSYKWKRDPEKREEAYKQNSD